MMELRQLLRVEGFKEGGGGAKLKLFKRNSAEKQQQLSGKLLVDPG